MLRDSKYTCTSGVSRDLYQRRPQAGKLAPAGVETAWAAERVKEMAGEFRVPILLKLVDARCREWE